MQRSLKRSLIREIVNTNKGNCKHWASYLRVAEKLESISGYKDADELAVECRRLAEEARIVEEKAEKEKQYSKTVWIAIITVAVIIVFFISRIF